MKNKNIILQGTLYLTLAGFISRILGFFYRIFLSNAIGATNLGIFQLSHPICGLCYSLTIAGIHTSISKYVSSNNPSDSKASIKILYAGLLISVIPTTILSVILYKNSELIAYYFLHEIKCAPIVALLALSLPFTSIHSCLNAYLYGKKKVILPSISQLIEQIVRISVVYFIYYICTQKNIPLYPSLAAYGMIIEEIVAILFMLTCFCFSSQYHPKLKDLLCIPKHLCYKIFKFSIPLTLNRLTLMLMQTLETILIPQMLHIYGLSNSESLATYGILTGMALPLILFPSAITNSLSVMLLPEISQAQSTKNTTKIALTIELTIKYCSILGIFFTSIFFIYGNSIGNLLFSNPKCVSYIKTLAWICPLLYLSSTLSSIINGIGKNFFSLVINCISLFIRIVFTYFLIPIYGIRAYLWGLLVAQLFITFAFIYYLKKEYSFSLHLQTIFLKPVFFLLIAYFLSIVIKNYLLILFTVPSIVSLLLSLSIFTMLFGLLLVLFNIIPLKH